MYIIQLLDKLGITGYIIDYKLKTVKLNRDNFTKLVKYFQKQGKKPITERIVKEYGYIFYS